MARIAILAAMLLVAGAPPPSTAVSTLASDSEDRWVPFDLTPGNQVRFTVEINGQRAVAILDTGVSASVVSQRFARSMRMRVQPRGSASAIGGAVAIGWTPVRTIAFGGMARRGGGMSVADLPAIATGDTTPVDLLIGHDLIDAYALDIDYDARRFRLLKSGRLPFRGISAPLAIGIAQNVYVTQIALGGGRLAPMIVDTGDGSAITLSQDAFRAARVAGLQTTTTIAYGLAGPLVTDLAVVPSLSVGRLEAHNIEVRIEPRGGFSQVIGAAGRIGTAFLQQYRVLLDPAAGHMVLAPTATTGTPPVRSTSGVLVAAEDNRLRVLHVMRGSPAQVSGWKAGDLVCSVDGTPVPADYSGSPMSEWSIGQPGRAVSLGMCDGAVRKLVLARFY